MKILSKYSKAQSLVNDPDVTQKEYIDFLKSRTKVESPEDFIRPYTYKEWIDKNYGIISGEETKQYDQYLKKWYENVFLPENSVQNLKQKYIAFLKEVTLVLNQVGNPSELANIDFDNDFEIQNSLPFFAKKLKEIALYLLTKREALKKAKLKYNTYGSVQGLERVLYEYLLKAFSVRNNYQTITDNDVLDTILPLSSVKDTFDIFIQEMYDDTWYLNGGRTDTSEFSFSPEVTGFYDSLGVPVSSYDWVFNTGYFELCADSPLFWTYSNIAANELPLSSLDLSDDSQLIEFLKFELTKKYMGVDLYYLTGGYFETKVDTFINNLFAGNNWFYFPSGDHFDPYYAEFPVDGVSLIDTSLSADGATGARRYIDADRIFLHYGNTVEGAWLKSLFDSRESTQLSALFEKNAYYEFLFPYSGYGLSGANFDWTGKSLSNLNKDFNYYDTSNKSSILSAYWSDFTSTSAIEEISIHNTSLIEDGATPYETFHRADYISLERSNEDGESSRSYAWLYKSDKSDIPVRRGQTFINWPLYRYDVNQPTITRVLSSQCDPLPLSSVLGHIGQRAGYSMHDSDIVYKLANYDGMPYECAFLSGAELNGVGGTSFTANATGVIQSALSLRCNPDAYVTFIWTDNDTPLSAVNIRNTPHQPDCQYLQQDLFSLLKENPSDEKRDINYSVWKTCDCKAIVYSPLGHTGSNYDDYAGFSDIIFLDYSYPTPFSFNTWRDDQNRDYRESPDFAWYQVTGSKPEPDVVGYGEGRWVAGGSFNTARSFVFKTGQQYKILRAGLKYDSTFTSQSFLPPLIIKYPYENSPSSMWMKAILNNDSQWVATTSASDMILNPSDYIMYDHVDSNWYCVTTIGSFGAASVSAVSSENLLGGIWQNYDYVTSGINIVARWPDTIVTGGPTTTSFQLTSVTWKVTPPTGPTTVYPFYSPDDPLYIYTDKVGNWTVSAIGYNSLGAVSANNIANFTVVSPTFTYTTTGEREIKTVYADTINFQISQPLSGWNYDEYAFSTETTRPSGMRPFWAYATDKPERQNKFKAIDVYGGNIEVYDDYTLISQPRVSQINFQINDRVGYYSVNEFIWLQNVNFIRLTEEKQWCKLSLSADIASNLSEYIYNNPLELVVSATDVPSDMVLEPMKDGYPVLVNYWAENSFTWTQSLTSSILGLSPTGGNFFPPATGLLAEAYQPHANLGSTYYPNIASVPRVDNLYSRKDKGGYFIPKRLGVTTYVSRGHTNVLDYDLSTQNRGLSGVFSNLDIYGKNIANDSVTSVIPVSTVKFNSEWMKARSNEYYGAGIVKDAVTHQTFSPYQTNYESKLRNNFGLSQQSDEYDPWTGEHDNEWSRVDYWPPNFRGEDQIESWYQSKQLSHLSGAYVHTWKMDVFGNQYALIKSYSEFEKISDKARNTGSILVRDQRDIVSPISVLLSGSILPLSYNPNYSEIYDQVVSGKVVGLDMWFDTICIETSGYLFLDKIVYDFETGKFNSNVSNQHVIDLSANRGGMNIGTWFFDDNKRVIFAHGLSANGIFTPYYASLNLDTNALTPIPLSDGSQTILNELSSVGLESIEDVQMTYDKYSKRYNLAFINNHSLSGMYIGLINLTDQVNSLKVDSLLCIEPVATS